MNTYAAILLDNECNTTTVNYHVTFSNALNTSVFLSVNHSPVRFTSLRNNYISRIRPNYH